LLRRRNDPHLAAGILDAAQHQAEEFLARNFACAG
jgi:hypothetical protein